MAIRLLVFVFLASFFAIPAQAQLLPSKGLLPPLPGVGKVLPKTGVDLIDNLSSSEGESAKALATPSLDRVSAGPAVARLKRSTLADLRRQRLDTLMDDYRAELDRDRDRRPVRRGEILVIDPDPAALAPALAAGFRVLRQERLGTLDLNLVVLSLPERADDVREGTKILKRAAPGLDFDYNHIFEPAGASLAPAAAFAVAANTSVERTKRIAMIDGGVASHPSLANASIRQRGFVGPVAATGHGTAVASLIAGRDGAFRGAMPGSGLLVADVYGGNPAAGSASAIARALAWAVDEGAKVVNVSLVGPPNKLMKTAIDRARARGVLVVAAVGNDGPAAPPSYPASYDGVVAVTGVDEDRRALREATRSKKLDFAAPGADLAAALPGKGYAEVRGTSFAAPLVSARLARSGSVAALASEAVKGKGKVGRGIVCLPCRIDPDQVGAK